MQTLDKFSVGMSANNINEVNFNNIIPTSGQIKLRKVFGVGNHPDIYFFNKDDILIISFHGESFRLDITRQNKQNLYKLEKEFSYIKIGNITITNNQISFRDIIKKAREISIKKYDFAFNNCNDSAKELIKTLYGQESYPQL